MEKEINIEISLEIVQAYLEGEVDYIKELDIALEDSTEALASNVEKAKIVITVTK